MSSPRMPVMALASLSCAAFTAVVTELLPAGLLPELSRDLGVPAGRAGFLVTGYALASFLSAIPVTVAVRGLPRRPILLTVLVCFAALNAGTALSGSYALTFALRLLAGVAGGTLWAMLVGYAARLVPDERRGRAIAIVSAGVTVALCAGIPAGSALAGVAGWRAAFAVLAAASALLAVWVWRSVPPVAGERAGRRLPLRAVLGLTGVRVSLAVTLVVLVGHQIVYTFLAPLAARAGLGEAGVALLVFGLATVAGVWLTGALIDGRVRALLPTALAGTVAAMTVLAVFGQHAGPLLGATAVWGLGFGGLPTLLQSTLIERTGARNADVATSLQTTVYNAGIAAGSFAGGLLLDGLGAVVLPWASLALLSLALAAVALLP
ncbi:MFS transporter [Rhizohabitans arisaemae]|uniref:MFS transporter n=1 Tax=Rhizohabitans arisaemae TaxID=2720610 RepID=UPI0024B2574C|nr:MFS transporter [Rhizohabitans arisaemae]